MHGSCSDLRKWRRRRPVDEVALILAFALGLTSVLVLVGVLAQILNKGFASAVTLSENATQVLIATVGGMTGLLGAYIGIGRSRGRDIDESEESEDDD